MRTVVKSKMLLAGQNQRPDLVTLPTHGQVITTCERAGHPARHRILRVSVNLWHTEPCASTTHWRRFTTHDKPFSTLWRCHRHAHTHVQLKPSPPVTRTISFFLSNFSAHTSIILIGVDVLVSTCAGLGAPGSRRVLLAASVVVRLLPPTRHVTSVSRWRRQRSDGARLQRQWERE
jgi:hypothetical protein